MQGGFDLVDVAVETGEAQDRGRAGGDVDVMSPVCFVPESRINALSIAAGCGALAVDDQVGRQSFGDDFAGG